MTNQSHRLQFPPLPGVRRALTAAALGGTLILASGTGRCDLVTVAGVTFDSAHATTTAQVTSGGYTTTPGGPIALHSGTSPAWTVPNSLGTLFQAPAFQASTSTTPTNTGLPGSAVTLGIDSNFPPTDKNPRDIIRLGWGATWGLGNGSGNDLAIFEAATSEVFGVRLHVDGSSVWTDWRYTPYQSIYDAATGRTVTVHDTLNDATVTLIEFSDFGVGAGIVTAIEIANLLSDDRVDTLITDTLLGTGVVAFSDPTTGYTPTTGHKPGRWSTGAQAWAPFEDTKFDPDIQYVVGLQNLTEGTYGPIAPASYILPLSPAFAAATLVPAPATLALLVPFLMLHGLRRRRSAA